MDYEMESYLRIPQVSERERRAYEVVTAQREPERARTIDDYVPDSAAYVAKRALIALGNNVEEKYGNSSGKGNCSIILKVYECKKEEGIRTPVIDWHGTRHIRDVKGEIDVASVYGFAFAVDVIYYYHEWFDALIDAFRDMLNFTGELDDEECYVWHIRLDEK